VKRCLSRVVYYRRHSTVSHYHCHGDCNPPVHTNMDRKTDRYPQTQCYLTLNQLPRQSPLTEREIQPSQTEPQVTSHLSLSTSFTSEPCVTPGVTTLPPQQGPSMGVCVWLKGQGYVGKHRNWIFNQCILG